MVVVSRRNKMYLQKVRFNHLVVPLPYEHLGYNVMYVTLNNLGYMVIWFLLGLSWNY